MKVPYLFNCSPINKHVKSLPTLIFHCYKIDGKEDTGTYRNTLIHTCGISEGQIIRKRNPYWIKGYHILYVL